MTSFTVECTTCRRRLLVRSDALIGQILPCPKCGSMVLIEAPAGHQPSAPAARPARTAAEQAAPTAASASAFDIAAGGPSDEIDRLLTAEDPQQADTVEDPLLSGNAPTTRPRPESQPALAESGAPATSPTTGTPATPAAAPAWMSEQSRLMKRWLAIGTLLSAAVILLIIVLGLAWSGRTPAVANRAPNAGASPREDGSAATTDKAADAAATHTAKAIDAGRDDANKNTDNSKSADEAGSSAQPSGTPADSTGGTSEDVEAAATGESSSPTAADPAPPAEATAEPATETPDSGTGDGTGAAAAPPVNPPPLGGLGPTARSPQALRDFDSLLIDSGFESAPVADHSPYDLIPAPGTPHDLAAAMPRPAAQVVNAATQLAIRIPELDFRNAQLGGFLRFVSDFTTLPVTVDSDALYRAGLSPRSAIELHATNEELQKSLTDALAPHGLRYVTHNGHLVVRQLDDDALVEKNYEVFDLIGDTPNEDKALEDVLLTLVMPGHWERAGGKGTLRITDGKLHVKAYPSAQWEVLMFCQRLRLARGLRPHGEMPAHVPGLALRFERALMPLAQPVTATHTVPVPLVQILDELAAAADVSFWVDWLALEEVGWNRAALARLEVAEQPLSQALQSLLGPMELSFRVIDERTFEITSATAAFQKLEIGFFPVRDRLASEGAQDLVDRVRTALGDSLAGSKGGSALRFDATSQTLVLAAPQYQLAAVARMLVDSR